MNAVENFLRIVRFDAPERAISKIPVYVIRYNGNMHEDYAGNGGDISPVGSTLLLESSPERITSEVRRLLWLLGQQGGFICAPDQDMPYSPTRRQALQAAVERYGRYPLLPPEFEP